MWCNPCRAVGMIHCAYPDECGNMLSGKAAADNWKAWLDDLPLDAGFAEGIGQVQDFISGTVARAEAAEAKVAELEAQIVGMIDADTVQRMLDSAQPIMAEACRGYEETIADLQTEAATLRAMQAEREAALQELRFHVDDAVKAWNAHEAAEAALAASEVKVAKLVEALTNLSAVYAHQINTGVREVYDPLQRFYTMESVLSAITEASQ